MDMEIDWNRIRHLLKLGIFASLMVLTGDMLLGWGVNDPAAGEVPAALMALLAMWIGGQL